MNRIMCFLIRIYRYGQMSWMAEPISGVLNASVVVVSYCWSTIHCCRFRFCRTTHVTNSDLN